MIDDSVLRARVREAMRAGELPDRLPERPLGDASTGARFAICGESTRDGVRVWSETGCTCVLITSSPDALSG